MSSFRRRLLRKRTDSADALEEIVSFSGRSSDDNQLSPTKAFNASRGFRIETKFTVNKITYDMGRILELYSADSSRTYRMVVIINVYNDGDPTLVYLRTADNVWAGIADETVTDVTGCTLEVKMHYDPKAYSLYVYLDNGFGVQYEETFPNVVAMEGDYEVMMLSGDPEWGLGSCDVTYEYFKVWN